MYVSVERKIRKTTFPLLNWEYLWVGFYPSEETNICGLHWSIGKEWSDIWNKAFCNLWTPKWYLRRLKKIQQQQQPKKKKKQNMQMIMSCYPSTLYSSISSTKCRFFSLRGFVLCGEKGAGVNQTSIVSKKPGVARLSPRPSLSYMGWNLDRCMLVGIARPTYMWLWECILLV